MYNVPEITEIDRFSLINESFNEHIEKVKPLLSSIASGDNGDTCLIKLKELVKIEKIFINEISLQIKLFNQDGAEKGKVLDLFNLLTQTHKKTLQYKDSLELDDFGIDDL